LFIAFRDIVLLNPENFLLSFLLNFVLSRVP
jgi:hypothetical protein